ncbi:MAG: short-chain dehydrogenase, partial [Myxococcota bacterium]
ASRSTKRLRSPRCPGYAATNLQHVGPNMTGSYAMGLLMTLGNALVAQSSAMGALPTVFAATAPHVHGGDYVGPDGPFRAWGFPTTSTPSRAARSKTDAAELWRRSVALTGVAFDALTAVAS